MLYVITCYVWSCPGLACLATSPRQVPAATVLYLLLPLLEPSSPDAVTPALTCRCEASPVHLFSAALLTIYHLYLPLLILLMVCLLHRDVFFTGWKPLPVLLPAGPAVPHTRCSLSRSGSG